MKRKTIESNLVRLDFRSDGIIHLHYLTEILDLKSSREVLEFTRLHSPWKLSPLLISGSEFTNQDKASLDFNGSEEVTKYCSAYGFITDSLAKKILANFFIKLNKGKIPMRFFNTQAEAIVWLKQYPTIALDK